MQGLPEEVASVPSAFHMLLWEPHLLQPRLLKNREPVSRSGSPPDLLRTESGAREKGFHSHQNTFHLKIFIKIMIKPEKGITRNQPFAQYFKNQQKKKKKKERKEREKREREKKILPAFSKTQAGRAKPAAHPAQRAWRLLVARRVQSRPVRAEAQSPKHQAQRTGYPTGT